MNLQSVVQTSGNKWPGLPSLHRAYEKPQRREDSHAPAPRAGLTYFDAIERQMADHITSQEAMIKEVNKRFGMVSDPLVAAFLAGHRCLAHILIEAFERLKEAFGSNIVVNLEVSTDEEGYQMLYAVTLWRDDANQAASAFNSFVDNWWIHKMNAATSDIAFVYQLI